MLYANYDIPSFFAMFGNRLGVADSDFEDGGVNVSGSCCLAVVLSLSF